MRLESTSVHLALAVVILAGSVASQQPTFANGHHEDPRVGYRIRVPDKWTMVPVDIDEKWIVGKYLCNRDYNSKLDGMQYKPELRVIHFSADKAKVQEKQETHGDTTYISKNTTFRNYKDWFGEYIKTTGLGFFIETETTEELGGMSVTKLEIMTNRTGEKVLKYVTWIFERKDDGSTVAVEFSQLHDWVKNVQTDFDRSLKSFRFIEVTAASAGAADTELENPMWTRFRSKWREMPKLERWKIRQSMEAKRRAMILAAIPEGWKTQDARSKRFVALTHADPKYTALVLDTADATWDWLDKRFGDISDEYVMAGVIRICKDYDEAQAYQGKSADGDSFSDDNREIVDFKDRDSGSGGGGQTNLITGLTNSYFYDKDTYAYAYTPRWLMSGLSSYLATADLEARKLNFKSDTWERVLLREAERENSLRTFNELISTPADDWPKDRAAYWRYRAQLSAMVRFLESREADRIRPLKGFVGNYVRASIKAGEEWVKTRPTSTQARSEEEEEAQAKDQSKEGRERRKFILDVVNKDAANFSQKDWLMIEAVWKKWLTK